MKYFNIFLNLFPVLVGVFVYVLLSGKMSQDCLTLVILLVIYLSQCIVDQAKD